jgi:hypothetical protein
MTRRPPHLLTEIDEDLLMAYCDKCETLVKIVHTGKYKTDGGKYWRCKTAHRTSTLAKRAPWRAHKKDYCEKCGFVALHASQLHVDHIDGSKANNDTSNLMTLCANCHAYKTAMNQDWMPNTFSPSAAK